MRKASGQANWWGFGLALVDAGTAPPPPASSSTSSSTPLQTENQALNNGPSISSTEALNPVVAFSAESSSNDVDAHAGQLKGWGNA